MTDTLTPPRESAAPPRTSVVRTELRRGVGPWTGAAVAVTLLVTMYGKAPGWQGRWTDATDMLHVATGMLAGPLALAAGCWQGGRDRRRGTLELLRSVPRGRLRRQLLAVAPSALWPVAGQLCAAAVCLLAGVWPYVSGGRPYLELVAADAVALASLGTLGHLAGQVVPWRLTAPLLAVVGYVGLGIGAYSPTSVRWLSPAAEHSFAWDKPLWWYAPASAAWTGGLGLAALVAYAARPARLRLLAVVPLALALTAAGAILRLPEHGPWRPDPEAARLVCDGGSPQVCLTSVDRALLPDVSRALAPLNERLRGLPGAPTRWVGGPTGALPGDVGLPGADQDVARGRLVHPERYANSAAQWLFSDTCRPGDFTGPDAERTSLVNLAVVEWLAPAPPGYGADTTGAQMYIARLKAMSPAEQRAYLTRYLAADTCRPEEVPIP
ncbi:hypothetical protein [Streptomyces sp. NPDC046712]|uniref:hypothetical protein n=1 Tax=Streptomyces sp. NPDC046712 TaxID=3154802 RepID=UPI0033FFB2EE